MILIIRENYTLQMDTSKLFSKQKLLNETIYTVMLH